MNKKVRDFLIKFLSGAFGSFVLLAIRGIPPLPGIGSQADHLYVGIGFVASGAIVTVIWQAGDDAPFRSFIFGLTWPALVAALTR